jgi:hypothetical protein
VLCAALLLINYALYVWQFVLFMQVTIF